MVLSSLRATKRGIPLLVLVAFVLMALTACNRYSDETREQHALNKLFVNASFVDLETELVRAERKYRSGDLSARAWEGRLHTVPDLNADGLEAMFDRWVAERPSTYAYLLRGKYFAIAAWEARGMRFWAETPVEKRTEFLRLARKAEPDLERAYEMMPGCAPCAAELISIGRALGYDKLDVLSLFEAALAADPKGRAAPVAYMAHLKPQWGGSFADMEQFIAAMRGRIADPSVVAELESIYCWEQARAAELRGDKAGELAWYEQGLTAQPYSFLMKNLAETYTELGRHADAAKVLERNLQVNDPWDLYTIEALALAYFRAGMNDKGRAMMARRDEAQFRYINHL